MTRRAGVVSGLPAVLCYIARMRFARAFFFGYFWFSSAPGGREI